MTRGGIFLAIVAWLAAFALTGEARAASPSGRPSASQPMLFTADEVAAIRESSNKLVPIELGGTRQLGLFGRPRSEEGT